MNPSHNSSTLVLSPKEDPIIQAENIGKLYRRGAEEVHALQDVSFRINRGELVAVVGPSGSGKTTLLNLLGCMDTPSTGSLRIAGKETRELGERALTELRRHQIGFVFQHFALLPTLSVAENVALPAMFAHHRLQGEVERLLEKMGLAHRKEHRPNQLSGGEMQRAAIARALINSPEILLADEPTGNLDSATGESIINLFHQLNNEGLTLIVVTHNPNLAASAGRQLLLQDGRLSSDSEGE